RGPDQRRNGKWYGRPRSEGDGYRHGGGHRCVGIAATRADGNQQRSHRARWLAVRDGGCGFGSAEGTGSGPAGVRIFQQRGRARGHACSAPPVVADAAKTWPADARAPAMAPLAGAPDEGRTLRDLRRGGHPPLLPFSNVSPHHGLLRPAGSARTLAPCVSSEASATSSSSWG